MTLILSYLCQEYAHQVSDRRLVVPDAVIAHAGKLAGKLGSMRRYSMCPN